MKATQRKIAGGTIVVMSIIGMALIVLGNPEMTQTQLLLSYPGAWTAFIFAICVGSWAITRKQGE